MANAADSAPVLMIGTDPDGGGGIALVVKALAADGLFERESVRYLISHREGSRADKAVAALLAFGQTFLACLFERPAVVHVHVASRASFARKSILLILARATGCRTIFHLHGVEFDRFAGAESGAPMRWWIRYTLERSSAVIVQADSRNVFVRDVAPAARIIVVPNVVPVSALQPDAGKLGDGRLLTASQLSALYRELRR